MIPHLTFNPLETAGGISFNHLLEFMDHGARSETVIYSLIIS